MRYEFLAAVFIVSVSLYQACMPKSVTCGATFAQEAADAAAANADAFAGDGGKAAP